MSDLTYVKVAEQHYLVMSAGVPVTEVQCIPKGSVRWYARGTGLLWTGTRSGAARNGLAKVRKNAPLPPWSPEAQEAMKKMGSCHPAAPMAAGVDEGLDQDALDWIKAAESLGDTEAYEVALPLMRRLRAQNRMLRSQRDALAVELARAVAFADRAEHKYGRSERSDVARLFWSTRTTMEKAGADVLGDAFWSLVESARDLMKSGRA